MLKKVQHLKGTRKLLDDYPSDWAASFSFNDQERPGSGPTRENPIGPCSTPTPPTREVSQVPSGMTSPQIPHPLASLPLKTVAFPFVE